MEKRSGFLTFLTALIPGVGYMYFGLLRKGIETLLLFLLIPTLFDAIGLGFLSYVVAVPIWFYSFFDTYHIAHKVDRGEKLQDGSIFNKEAFSGEAFTFGEDIKNRNWIFVAWALIIIGILAILNKMFMYIGIFSIARQYFVPVIFIVLGVYLLTRKK
ncbi:MAG: hypothetical protein Q8936_16575 [Bacillota bacterium]|nr:hypothetical protein [Bacillota bacterium]